MKKHVLLFTSLLICSSVFAQKDSTKAKVDSIQTKIHALKSAKDSIIAADTMRYWKKGGLIGINFSQSSFTNWAAGGENALSVTSLVSLFANYKKDKDNWDNTLDLAYGMLQTGIAPLRKNEDKIDFSSKYGRYAFLNHWYYTALVNFKSQFADGYNYPNDSIVISHFMAPGYLLGGIGMDFKTKDNSFSLFLSPLTSKTIFVNDQKLADAGAYGVDKAKYDSVAGIYVMVEHGKMISNQFGGYLKMTFKKDIFKNVNFATKLELFSNYLKNPQNIVVNWETLIGLKVNKFISTSISTNLIYDNDIPVPVKREVNGIKVDGTGPRVQFKEILAVGFSYKF